MRSGCRGKAAISRTSRKYPVQGAKTRRDPVAAANDPHAQHLMGQGTGISCSAVGPSLGPRPGGLWLVARRAPSTIHAQRCFSLRIPLAEPATGSAKSRCCRAQFPVNPSLPHLEVPKYQSTLATRPLHLPGLPIVILKLGPLPASIPSIAESEEDPFFFPHHPPPPPTPSTQERACVCTFFSTRGEFYGFPHDDDNDDSLCHLPTTLSACPIQLVCRVPDRRPVVPRSTAKIEIASPNIDFDSATRDPASPGRPWLPAPRRHGPRWARCPTRGPPSLRWRD